MGPNKIVALVLIAVLFSSPVVLGQATAVGPMQDPVATPAADGNPLQLQQIPEMWKKLTCGDETMGCYRLEQLKVLKQYDIDISLRFQECDICRQTLLDDQRIQENLNKLLKLGDEREKNWKSLAETKSKDVTQMAWDLTTCQNKLSIGQVLPWLIVGTVLLAAGTFGIGYAVGHNQ